MEKEAWRELSGPSWTSPKRKKAGEELRKLNDELNQRLKEVMAELEEKREELRNIPQFFDGKGTAHDRAEGTINEP